MKKIKINIQMFADGKVVIDTDLDSKGFKSGLDKMQSIAKTGFKAIGTAVGVASGAIAGLVGKSVSMAGQLEQNLGGAEAVFGKLGDSIRDMQIEFKNDDGSTAYFKSLEATSLNAFETMGIAQSDYLATINKMGSLMQGAGLDTQTSLQLSSEAMQRAADVASIMGIDVNSAMESIAGAAKGNFTMMDNLGVAMNATTIEAYALSKGIGTSFNEMDNATKVGLAMEMFLEKTAYAAGNYAKENETFAGSFSTLKAATSNFLSGAGGIEDVADALVGFGDILVESITQMAPTIIEGLIQLTEVLLPQIPILIESLLPTVLDGAISLINGLIAIFPALIKLIKDNLPTIIQGGILIVKTLVNAIVDMLPDLLEAGVTLLLELVRGIAESLPELIPTIIDAVILIVETLIDNLDLIIMAGIDLILALALGIVDAIPMLISKIPTIITKIIMALTEPEMILKLVTAGMQLLVGLGKGLIQAIPELLALVPQVIKSLFDKIKTRIKETDWLELGKNVLKGILNGLLDFGSLVKNTIKKLGNKIVGGIKDFFGIKSPSRLMRDEVGKYIASGIGVGFEKEIDSVYNDMEKAISLETNKMTASVQASGNVVQMLNSTAQFTGNINNVLELDGEVVYQNQQVITARKNLQYGGGN